MESELVVAEPSLIGVSEWRLYKYPGASWSCTDVHNSTGILIDTRLT